MDDLDRYLFVASGIAGHWLPIHAAADPQSLACSDGRAIILPAGGSWQEIAAQSILIGAGSLEPYLMRKLVGRGRTSGRYCYLEVIRGAKLLSDRIPDAFLALPEFTQAGSTANSAEGSLALALADHTLPDPPRYFGVIRPWLVLRNEVNTNGLAALTKKQRQGDFKKTNVEQFGEDEQVEESRLLKLLNSPLSLSLIADIAAKIFGTGVKKGRREENPNEGGGSEIPVGLVEQTGHRGRHSIFAELPSALREIERMTAGCTFTYPEWDVHGARYRPAFTKLGEVAAWRPGGPRNLQHIAGPSPRELRRRLGAIRPDHTIQRNQREGADFDMGRLIDCSIELAAGYSPPSLDIYRASRRRRRDLAITVALDISGSTGENNGTDKTVFDKQIGVAFQLGQTLTSLGDSVTLFGFRSWGRQNVQAIQLKGPQERWSGEIIARFSQLEPAGYTRTGTAIRHGIHTLNSSMRLPNRLLVLISDGIAYDDGYESVYADSDVRKALEEANNLGIGCICLCIGGSVETERLQNIFGAVNLLIVDEPHEIIPSISRLCLQALASVSRRRYKKEPVSLE